MWGWIDRAVDTYEWEGAGRSQQATRTLDPEGEGKLGTKRKTFARELQWSAVQGFCLTNHSLSCSEEGGECRRVSVALLPFSVKPAERR